MSQASPCAHREAAACDGRQGPAVRVRTPAWPLVSGPSTSTPLDSSSLTVKEAHDSACLGMPGFCRGPNGLVRVQCSEQPGLYSKCSVR